MAKKKSKTPTGRHSSGTKFDLANHENNEVQRKRKGPVPRTLNRTYYDVHIMLGIAALLAIAFLYGASSNNRQVINQQNQSTKDSFLKWFTENGGTFHVNVTIEEFPSYGGWGLALPSPTELSHPSDECQSDNADGQCTAADYEKSPIIRHLDPLFTVPSSIIISVQSILDTYTFTSSPLYLSDFYPNINKILTRAFPNGPGLAKRGMGLVEQDAVIAMYLMAEECQHGHTPLFKNNEDSRWAPYLDVLPKYTIPRLDSFGDEEYAVLQDANLEHTGRNSRRLLEQMYLNDDSGTGTINVLSLKSVVEDMIHQKIGPTTPSIAIPAACISFETFHRFVAIVSSRAMLLKDVKQ